LRLLKSAAEKGYGRADAYLVWPTTWGRAFPSTTLQRKHGSKGAKQHDPEAECFLAIWDEKEPGRAPDLAREAELLRLSAASGYVEAMHGLGLSW
jgi:hypothetical protein